MSVDVIVRRFGSPDAARLVGLLDELSAGARHERTCFPHHEAHVARALATPGCCVFVAFEAGTALGYASGYRFPRLDRAGDQVYLFDIEVVPRARRRGVGRLLLDSLLAACWAEGVTWAWAGTARENLAAQRLFAAAGGARIGETYTEYHFTPER